MATPAEIQAILETSRYMPEAVQILEDYVQQQCQQCTYDFEPNLAIIKLYQFFPEKVNRSILAKVLVKALMNLPATDFLLCMYLIPERMQAEEPVNSISNLANLLETCRFAQFWEEAKAADDFLGTIPGFEAAIRSCTVGSLVSLECSCSYKIVSYPRSSERHISKNPACPLQELLEIGRRYPVSLPRTESLIS